MNKTKSDGEGKLLNNILCYFGFKNVNLNLTHSVSDDICSHSSVRFIKMVGVLLVCAALLHVASFAVLNGAQNVSHVGK